MIVSANTERINVPEDLVRAMVEAGCVEVGLGFESGSERSLHELNKRFEFSRFYMTPGLRVPPRRPAGFHLDTGRCGATIRPLSSSWCCPRES